MRKGRSEKKLRTCLEETRWLTLDDVWSAYRENSREEG